MVCRRCGIDVIRLPAGTPYQPNQMHLDHVVHWAVGGGNTLDNLIVCCAGCNLSRRKPTTGDIVRGTHLLNMTKKAALDLEQRMMWARAALEDGYADFDWWWGWRWARGYAPPVVIEHSEELLSCDSLAREMGLFDAEIVLAVVCGDLAATAGSQMIHVRPPEWVAGDIERRFVSQTISRSTDLPRRPRSEPVPLTPLAASWEEMRRARIAKERAAKEARRQALSKPNGREV
jgi:hypothetical protein